jgi:hypothetical protein
MVIYEVPQRVIHVACMGKLNMSTKFYSENMKDINNLDVPGVERRIILKWILTKLCDVRFMWVAT